MKLLCVFQLRREEPFREVGLCHVVVPGAAMPWQVKIFTSPLQNLLWQQQSSIPTDVKQICTHYFAVSGQSEDLVCPPPNPVCRLCPQKNKLEVSTTKSFATPPSNTAAAYSAFYGVPYRWIDEKTSDSSCFQGTPQTIWTWRCFWTKMSWSAENKSSQSSTTWPTLPSSSTHTAMKVELSTIQQVRYQPSWTWNVTNTR